MMLYYLQDRTVVENHGKSGNQFIEIIHKNGQLLGNFLRIILKYSCLREDNNVCIVKS